jgi:superfamily II helicase
MKKNLPLTDPTRINSSMKRRYQVLILIATQRKRTKRRRKSHQSRCAPFSVCRYPKSSRSISTLTRMSTIRCLMICRGKTQMRIRKRMKKSRRKSMEISSRGKTWIKMMTKKRLTKDSKSTNKRCYNKRMMMQILITRNLFHMTCLCNEIWAQTQ